MYLSSRVVGNCSVIRMRYARAAANITGQKLFRVYTDMQFPCMVQLARYAQRPGINVGLSQTIANRIVIFPHIPQQFVKELDSTLGGRQKKIQRLSNIVVIMGCFNRIKSRSFMTVFYQPSKPSLNSAYPSHTSALPPFPISTV